MAPRRAVLVVLLLASLLPLALSRGRAGTGTSPSRFVLRFVVCRRGVRVREPLQPGVRRQHGGAEHGALQQRPQLRRLLRGAVRRGGRRRTLLPAGLRRRHRHQLLPAQQRAPLRRRRLVHPAPRTLRHVAARVPAHRALQGRHCPRLLPQGRVQQEGRHPVHHQRPLLLKPGPGHQPRRRREERPASGPGGAPCWAPTSPCCLPFHFHFLLLHFLLISILFSFFIYFSPDLKRIFLRSLQALGFFCMFGQRFGATACPTT